LEPTPTPQPQPKPVHTDWAVVLSMINLLVILIVMTVYVLTRKGDVK
jgi:hypothetical protein